MNDMEEVYKIVSKETLRESVRQSRLIHHDYIQKKLDDYRFRNRYKKALDVKVVAFLGHGRSGKDESARIFSTMTDAVYGKSTSWIMHPIVATSLGVSPEFAWEHRHRDRLYWKAFCDLFREEDATCIAKMLLADSDVLVGIRGKPEFYAVMGANVAQHAVWVHREGVPHDPTMDYGLHDLKQFETRYSYLDNSGSLNDLEIEIGELVDKLNMRKKEPQYGQESKSQS